MGKMMTFAAALVMAMLLTGCGGDTHEKVTVDMGKITDELATVLEGVKDEASAKSALSKIESIKSRMEDLGKRMKALGPPKAEDALKLAGKGFEVMAKSADRLEKEAARIKADPKLSAILDKALDK